MFYKKRLKQLEEKYEALRDLNTAFIEDKKENERIDFDFMKSYRSTVRQLEALVTKDDKIFFNYGYGNQMHITFIYFRGKEYQIDGLCAEGKVISDETFVPTPFGEGIIKFIMKVETKLKTTKYFVMVDLATKQFKIEDKIEEENYTEEISDNAEVFGIANVHENEKDAGAKERLLKAIERGKDIEKKMVLIMEGNTVLFSEKGKK